MLNQEKLQGKKTFNDLMKKLALRSRISAPEVLIPTRINTDVT